MSTKGVGGDGIAKVSCPIYTAVTSVSDYFPTVLVKEPSRPKPDVGTAVLGNGGAEAVLDTLKDIFLDC